MLTQRPRFPRFPRGSIATSLTAGSMALLIAPAASAIELGLDDDMASALDDGMMIPMGDAKGAALVLMVEILAATLTGFTVSLHPSAREV